MPEVWEGKAYKMTESENFDDYMKALGKWKKSIPLKKMNHIHSIWTILNDRRLSEKNTVSIEIR